MYLSLANQPKVPRWSSQGLLPFLVRGVENCVPLCQTCHKQFDTADIGWVFLPVDLQYFIQFELEDQRKRSMLRTTRSVPTAAEYRAHLYSLGLLSADTSHGLYQGWFLKDFLLGGKFPLELLRSITSPKGWHGHPLAAIKKGFMALGSTRSNELHASVRQESQTLKDLYFPANIDPRLAQVNYPQPPQSPKRKRQDSPDRGEKRHMTRDPRSEDTANSEWVLGPVSTANDAMHRFGPVLRARDVKLLGK